ncbi:MAG: type IV pilus biogenesis/stability protein PilW [Methylococcales bacterium]|nr:type IV pilus biogenesis/stability protein PilW [Methylococcales bacterium]
MKSLLITSLSFFLIACVQVNPPRKISDKEQSDVHLKMGVRYLEMGQLEIAKNKLEKSVDFDSNNSEAHNALAVLYERIKRIKDAEYHYKKSVSNDGEKPQSRNNYGRFLCEQGRYEDGLKHLSIAFNMPLNSRKWFAFTNAGFCYLKQNNMEKAESHFRQALKVNPNYPPALLEMQKMSYRFHKFMSARAFLQRYLSVSPPSSTSLWYAYRTELGLKNNAEALKYKNTLLLQFPDSKEASLIKQ